MCMLDSITSVRYLLTPTPFHKHINKLSNQVYLIMITYLDIVYSIK